MEEKKIPAEYEETYSKLLQFYDLAESLIDTVERPDIRDPEFQLESIEPVVEVIEASTEFLTEEYRKFVSTGKKPGRLAQKKIEQMLIDIYNAAQSCEKALTQR